MKRILISLLALLLALCMLLVGCNEEPPAGNNNPPDDNGGKNPPAQTTTYTRTENYMPAEVYTQMKTYFESTERGFLPYDNTQRAPLVSTDVFGISNAVVKSITIPVFSTGKADEFGDFTFSIYVLPNAYRPMRNAITDPPKDPIVIKINAEEHGLEQNKTAIRKFIKVDLSDYDIKLTAGQTLGFSHEDDTLIPARVQTAGTVDNLNKEKYVPAKYLIDEWNTVGYFYYDTAIDPETGKAGGFSYTNNSLLFDFELERTFESEAAYNAEIAAKAQAQAEYAAKLSAVKAAYAGKSFSLIGDSISTFGGVTNDPTVHPTLKLNKLNYTIKSTVYDYTKTYWGKLSVDTGMDLCVINAWSGGSAYGRETNSYKDNMLLRSNYLATAAGKRPDVIFLNYATNDMLRSPSSTNLPDSKLFSGNLPTGDLSLRLSDTNKTKTDKEIVGEWLAEVEQKAKNAGYKPEDPSTIKPGETYVTWEAAYALSLQNIKRLYPDAEIYIITIFESNSAAADQPRLGNTNAILAAFAEYFGAGLVALDKLEATKENCHMYASDTSGVHPNGKGHALMTDLIVETLYERLPKN